MKAIHTLAAVFLSVLPVALSAAEFAVANTTPLAFGTFSSGSGGTVTVSTSGSCSADGGVVIFVANCAPATFTVSGDPDFIYVIELPTDNFVSLSGPGGEMTITGLVSEPAGGDGLLGAGGSQNVTVGGTLNVGSDQGAGSYSGSFSMIVNYN